MTIPANVFKKFSKESQKEILDLERKLKFTKNQIKFLDVVSTILERKNENLTETWEVN